MNAVGLRSVNVVAASQAENIAGRRTDRVIFIQETISEIEPAAAIVTILLERRKEVEENEPAAILTRSSKTANDEKGQAVEIIKKGKELAAAIGLKQVMRWSA